MGDDQRDYLRCPGRQPRHSDDANRAAGAGRDGEKSGGDCAGDAGAEEEGTEVLGLGSWVLGLGSWVLGLVGWGGRSDQKKSRIESDKISGINDLQRVYLRAIPVKY